MMMTVPPSERLTYRLMDVDDSERFYQLDQDPQVMKYINGGTPSSRDDIEHKLMPRLAQINAAFSTIP
ncbi:GNAT family N-acetyltransferase [Thalassotalea maritima]|uniref:GNAT family N-acetyltransferase n=1 Tax=Thalassotalea maritima TaxID=3242416 RepID=UPI003528A106